MRQSWAISDPFQTAVILCWYWVCSLQSQGRGNSIDYTASLSLTSWINTAEFWFFQWKALFGTTICCQTYSGWRNLIVSHFQLAQAYQLAKVVSELLSPHSPLIRRSGGERSWHMVGTDELENTI